MQHDNSANKTTIKKKQELSPHAALQILLNEGEEIEKVQSNEI